MGLALIMSQLESLGILPKGSVELVSGIKLENIFIPIMLAIGVYLIFHIPVPKFKTKLQRKQEELDLLKIDIDILRAKKELYQEDVARNNVLHNNLPTNTAIEKN